MFMIEENIHTLKRFSDTLHEIKNKVLNLGKYCTVFEFDYLYLIPS